MQYAPFFKKFCSDKCRRDWRKENQDQSDKKAKELIDIMAPGGNYFFNFDKSALSITDVKPENHVAVLEYVIENGKYSNAGQQVTTAKKEDSIIKYKHLYPEYKSKYNVSFDEYLKEHPPVDDRIIPLMREAYQKYANIISSLRV